MSSIVPTPVSKPVEPSYRRLDFAYACFALIALALCFFLLLTILPISQEEKGGYALLFGVPITLAALLAAIVHRSERQLVFLAAASVVFLVIFFLDEDAMDIAANLYLLALIALCGNWFFHRRRKMKLAERANRF